MKKEVKEEDEDDEKQVELDEFVPAEDEESDIEDFDAFIGVDGDILDNIDMPELEADPGQVEGDNSDDEDEMGIEDASEDEMQEVSEPEKTPPPMSPTLVRDSIPCPIKSCMHRKINKQTKKGSNNKSDME